MGDLLLPTLLMVGSVGLVWGLGWAGARAAAPGAAGRLAAGAALWLALSAGLALGGALGDFARTPPPLVLLVVASGALAVGLALSPLGRRLADDLPLAGLVGFQGFRVLVELMLALLHRAGVAPAQMTFEGLNFDIASGASALLVAWLAARGRLPGWGLALWNAAGLALLAAIVAISVLSLPLPFRVFHGEPANTFVAGWPFVWLPTFLVPAALLGHLLVARRLLGGVGVGAAGSPEPAAAR